MKNKEEHIDQFKKQKPFKVPENYFDDFALKMQHKISEEQTSTSWLDKLNLLIKWRVSIPTAVVIMLVISIPLLENIIEPQDKQLTYAAVSTYLIEEAAYLDDDELYDLTFGLDEDSEEELEEDAIIDYLIEVEGVDLQIIENSIN